MARKRSSVVFWLLILLFVLAILVFLGVYFRITGKVVFTNLPPCVDSDNGTSYFVKGTVTGPTGNSLTGLPLSNRSDFCKDSKSLVEYYCVGGKWGKQYVMSENYPCVAGCKDGACIGKSCKNGEYRLRDLKDGSYFGVQKCVNNVWVNKSCQY